MGSHGSCICTRIVASAKKRCTWYVNTNRTAKIGTGCRRKEKRQHRTLLRLRVPHLHTPFFQQTALLTRRKRDRAVTPSDFLPRYPSPNRQRRGHGARRGLLRGAVQATRGGRERGVVVEAAVLHQSCRYLILVEQRFLKRATIVRDTGVA